MGHMRLPSNVHYFLKTNSKITRVGSKLHVLLARSDVTKEPFEDPRGPKLKNFHVDFGSLLHARIPMTKRNVRCLKQKEK